MPDACFATSLCRAEELNDAAIWCPCRCFVLPAIGEQAFAGAIWTHRANAKVTSDAGEGNQVSARAPFRRRIAAGTKADAALIAAVGVHHIDLLAARTVAFKYDLAAIGGKAAADINAGRAGQLYRRAIAGGCNFIDVGISRHCH